MSRPTSGGAARDDAHEDGRARFLRQLAGACADGTLRRLRLNRPVGQDDLVRVDARPIVLKGEPSLSFVWHHRHRDITRNLPVGEAVDWIGSVLGETFGAAVLTTDRRLVELTYSRKGKPLLRSIAVDRGSEAPAPSGEGGDRPGGEAAGDPRDGDRGDGGGHNRRKSRWIDASRPFLAALGVTDARGEVIPAMSRKWRQIDRFVEVVVGAWRDASPDPALGTDARPIRVVDFGAGRGYLTFALYDYLTSQGLSVRMTGVERRPDLVDAGNRIAGRLGFSGLDFVAGDIVDDDPEAIGADGHADGREDARGDRDLAPIDVMIALHACDTATDDALYRGLQAGAAVLICSPCCHKEIRPQLLAPHPLAPLMRHGIQRGEMAEMITDTMRALLLETRGYEARIFEFIALEHTARNRMILATRRMRPADVDATRAQYDALKSFHGVREQRLEALLAGG